MSDPLDEELTRMLQYHVDNHGSGLDGVNPPDSAQAAEGTWRDEPEAPPAAPAAVQKPAPIPAASPAAKLDLSGFRPPTPAAAPLRDVELEGLQANAKGARQDAKLGKAVTDFSERPTNFLDYAQRLGGGGVSAPPPKNEAWKSGIEEADAAIGDLKERRTSSSAMAASAEDSDVNSPTAQTYRSVLLKFAPDLAEKLKGANAKQMRTMAPWLEKFHAENNDLLQAEATAKAKAAQQAKTDTEKAAALKLAQDHYAQGQKNSDRSYEAQMANAAATRELAASAAKAKGEKDVEDDVQQLSKALPGDEADFNRKAKEIHADIDASPGDIEGVGPIDNMKPAWLQSDRGLRIQKNAGQMQAAWKKLITGTGGGAAEMANLDKIGIQLGNEKSFLAGLDALEKGYAEKVKSVRAGFRPEVVKTLDERRGREGVGATPAASPERKQSKSGKWMVKDAAGDWSWE